MYTLKATNAKFSLSRSILRNFPINRALTEIQHSGARAQPAIVAHAPGKQRPEWWEGWKLACGKKSLDNCKHSRNPQVTFFKKISLLKCLKILHWDHSTRCLLWDGGSFSLQLPIALMWRKLLLLHWPHPIPQWLFDLSRVLACCDNHTIWTWLSS